MMRIFLCLFFLFAMASVSYAVAPGDVQDPYRSESLLVDARHVVDPRGVLEPQHKANIEQMCDWLEREAGSRVMVVVQDSLDSTPYVFAHALFSLWGLGQEADNLLMLVEPSKCVAQIVVSPHCHIYPAAVIAERERALGDYLLRREISAGVHSAIVNLDIAAHDFLQRKLVQQKHSGVWRVKDLPYRYDKNRFVLCDPLSYLARSESGEINNLCNSLFHKYDLETVVVLVDNIDSDHYSFCYELAERWRIESKRSLILLVSVADSKKWQFFAGREAEEALPDVLLGRVGRRCMNEPFESGQVFVAIRDGLQTIDRLLADDDFRYSFGDDEPGLMSDFAMMNIIWIIVVICGAIRSVMLADASTPLEKVSGSRVSKSVGRKSGYVTYSDNVGRFKWSLWGGHWLQRFLLVDVAFYIVVVISALGDVFIVWLLVGLAVYGSYLGVAWCLAALGRVKAECRDEASAHACYSAIFQSDALKVSMCAAPYYAVSVYFKLKRMLSDYHSVEVACPVCHSKGASLAPEASFASSSQAQQFEEQQGVMARQMMSCPIGHSFAYFRPGANFLKFEYCPCCKAFSAVLTSSEVGAQSEQNLVCQCCGNKQKAEKRK